MAFKRMVFTPEAGLKDKIVFPTVPANEESAREQFQRLLDQVKVQVNALMAALEAQTASANIGSGTLGNLEGGGNTVASQLAALSAKLHAALTEGLNLSSVIEEGDIDTLMIADSAVTGDKLAEGAVTAIKLSDGAVTPDKLGEMTSILLAKRTEVGEGEQDMIAYDEDNKKLMLSMAGLDEAQLVPVVYGTDATVSGSYPPGTIYVQHV